MIRRVGTLVAIVTMLFLTMPVNPAQAAGEPKSFHIPFTPDCKGAPVPDVPGTGLAAFFSGPPARLPKAEDPFKSASKTTIFEQYGYAGMRFNNYDLGCGPDAARDPGAVIGTAMANWMIQLPIALTALTGSITQWAFHPSFLGAFDPVITRVSTALHRSIFATWIPVVLAVLGLAIIFKARRAALATSAAAVGWSLLVVMIATALFRWPIPAGHLADNTVTGTLGAVVTKLDGSGTQADPGTAVASQVDSAVFYRAWLAGTLGSADSPTAKEYGPRLFRDQALTWQEASKLKDGSGDAIIKAKQDDWKKTASKIQDSDPVAYEYLTGRRSEARVGYAVMATVATYLALPFLLLTSLLLLGCFMIVRLAVMMFPAFATLGAFPSSRGIVIGLGRTVGAAIVNAIVFGIGSGVTVMVLGLLFAPGHGTPGWLGLVLMPLFTFIMWMALRPFRRLTHMVSPHDDHFRTMSGALGDASRSKAGFLKRAAVTAVGAYTGNVAAAATVNAMDDQAGPATPRAETQPSSEPRPQTATPRAIPAPAPDRDSEPPPRPSPGNRRREDSATGPAPAWQPPVPNETPARPPKPVEPETIDGEEIYTIYRPSDDVTESESAHDAA